MMEDLDHSGSSATKVTHRLAAIMFTDIVGYTAMMDEDEDKAFVILRRNLEMQRSLVEKYRGHWLKEIGDGVLVSFDTTTDGVSCAKEILNKTISDPELRLRIGIHQGEVRFQDGDVLGGGVNIASRIQALAQPDGIWISESVYRDISGKKDFQTVFVGERKLRHVRDPIKLYAVKVDGIPLDIPVQEMPEEKKSGINKLVLWGVAIVAILLAGYLTYIFTWGNEGIDHNSIAVLPFTNLDEDPETEYFIEGIRHEIFGNLARIPNMRVTPLRSVERYRHDSSDGSQIGKDLNVRYLLSAGVRQFDDQVRIIFDLSDASADTVVWTGSYTEEWTATIRLPFEVSLQIVQLLPVSISDSDVQLMSAVHKTDPAAYDFLLQGMNAGDWDSRQEMYENALSIDSTYAMAWYKLGRSLSRPYFDYHPGKRNPEQKRRAKEAYNRALALQPDLLEARLGQAVYLYECERDFERSVEIMESLLREYPQNRDLMEWLGAGYRRTGEFEAAAELWKQALFLESEEWYSWNNYTQILYILRRYKEAAAASRRCIDIRPGIRTGYRWLFRVQLEIDGDTRRVRETLDNPLMKDDASFMLQLELMDRNYDQAIEHAKKLNTLELARIYYYQDRDSARVLFEEVIEDNLSRIRNAKMEDQEPDPYWFGYLGIAYAGVGEKQKAIDFGVMLVEAYDEGWAAGTTKGNLVDIYIMVGEYDRALTLIRNLLDKKSLFSFTTLKLHPKFDPLRDLPEFQEILNDPKYRIRDGKTR